MVPGSHWLWVVCPQPAQSWLYGVTRPVGMEGGSRMWGERGASCSRRSPRLEGQSCGMPQERFCRAMFAEAGDPTNAGETQLFPRTSVLWR